jgi:C-type mannose receptor
MKNINFTYAESYWIGLNDLQEENTWVWVNNNKHVTYTDWYTNQPDNSRNNENCALIAEPYGYLWNDASCSLSLNYICESEAE